MARGRRGNYYNNYNFRPRMQAVNESSAPKNEPEVILVAPPADRSSIPPQSGPGPQQQNRRQSNHPNPMDPAHTMNYGANRGSDKQNYCSKPKLRLKPIQPINHHHKSQAEPGRDKNQQEKKTGLNIIDTVLQKLKKILSGVLGKDVELDDIILIGIILLFLFERHKSKNDPECSGKDDKDDKDDKDMMIFALAYLLMS